VAAIVSVLSGVALVVLSIRGGLVRERYGSWDRVIGKAAAPQSSQAAGDDRPLAR
jgi:hypothetical protein